MSAAPQKLTLPHSRRQLFANAAIAASRVRRIAVRRRPVLVVPEGERPHPRRAYGRRGGLEDATDHRTIGEHVEVVIAPLAGGPGGGRAFEDQRRHSHAIVELHVSICRPASVIFKRTTLSVRPPATTRSVVALVRPAFISSTSSAILKPCASMRALSSPRRARSRCGRAG